MAKNDAGSMTKQELEQALKDRDQANQAKEQALQEKNRAFKENQAYINPELKEEKRKEAAPQRSRFECNPDFGEGLKNRWRTLGQAQHRMYHPAVTFSLTVPQPAGGYSAG